MIKPKAPRLYTDRAPGRTSQASRLSRFICRSHRVGSRQGLAAAVCIWLALALAPAPARPLPPPGAALSPRLAHSPLADLPGPRPDGSVLLPNLWSLRPAGQQVELGNFPVNLAVHPGGRFAAVLHCGFGRHAIWIVDLKAAKVVSHTLVPEAFYGLEFSRRGDRLYCSGGSDEVVHVFDFAGGRLTPRPDLRLRATQERGIPCGLALSRNGRSLYVANVWGQCVSQVNLLDPTHPADIFFTAGHDLASFKGHATFDPDVEAVTKRAAAALDPTRPDAPFPYACRLDERRRRLYVSLWAQACVAVVDLKTRRVVDRWPTQEHPNEMLLAPSGRRLFVANANRNTVSVLDTATGKTLETLDGSLLNRSPDVPDRDSADVGSAHAGAPALLGLPGSTPNSLALSPDEKTLFVANALNNNVAVFDVSRPGRSRSLGFIPVGWYPTSVRLTPDGRQLLVVNGKGLGSRANPNGPQAGKRENAATQDIKALFRGTLSLIHLPRRKELAAWLAPLTARAYRCLPQLATMAATPRLAGPIPATLGRPSPIKYCIYIIKENRTYDQVLGDLPQGNGDPSLCLFPEKVTPNHHKLARQFVLLDNFYVEAEISAQGHEWSMGAYCSDFVEKTWPLQYGHNRSGKYPFPAEGNFPIATPANGYLWDRARQAGISYRSYGEFIEPAKNPADPNRARLPALQGHFDPLYRPFDLNYSDIKRAERFIAEWHRFESQGGPPRLQIVRLGNDHTCGALPGRLTPTAYLAENDRALGMIVEAVSHSKLWPQTAIFVVEDDAQNGPDHVDAHRTVAFAISPYSRHGAVDSTMYSTSSMLRTMELILGLRPMSQFDALATPMFNAFQPKADLRPYNALATNVDLEQRNGPRAWGARASRKMDFSKEDAADDFLLNEIVWRSVRGPDHPMPAPIHAAFVFAHSQEQDDD